MFEKRRIDLLKNSTAKSFNQLRLTKLVLEQPNIKADQLKEVKALVLVMAGQNDVITEDHTRLISKSLSQSELYIFPGGDHYVAVKQLEKFNKVVLDFMLDK